MFKGRIMIFTFHFMRNLLKEFSFEFMGQSGRTIAVLKDISERTAFFGAENMVSDKLVKKKVSDTVVKSLYSILSNFILLLVHFTDELFHYVFIIYHSFFILNCILNFVICSFLLL